VQSLHPDSKTCWVAGYSFGAWIGMQLLMRRPEIEGFISIAPQPNTYDFSFLAPCPSSGLIIHGDADKVAPPKDVQGLVDKLHTQKGITITQKTMPGANHFFASQEDADRECADYLDRLRAWPAKLRRAGGTSLKR
jgi:alpha/beta superfamily hydrolase